MSANKPDLATVKAIVRDVQRGEYDGLIGHSNLRTVARAYAMLEEDAVKLMTELRNRSWVSLVELQPEIGAEVLIRFDDQAGAHVELMEWNQEEAEFFADECKSKEVFWMRLPPL